jgi:Domain of unknown function (DUF3854)
MDRPGDSSMSLTNGSTRQRHLLAHHLEDLRRSGLSEDSIHAGGFFSMTKSEDVRRALNWGHSYRGELGPCLAIPFFDANGRPMRQAKHFHAVSGDYADYVRLKPDSPGLNDEGTPRKYESPCGEPNHAYFPTWTRSVLQDPSIPLLITEGEKKAAKADQEKLPCIGLVGVWGWQQKRPRGADGKPRGPRILLSELADIAWQGRIVYIVFDSDAATKKEIQQAQNQLKACLAPYGADVRIIALPSATDGNAGKTGLDDFLVHNGRDGFAKLLSAPTAPTPTEGKPLDQLMKLALERVQLFHDGSIAYVKLIDSADTMPLAGRDFKFRLRHWWFAKYGIVLRAEALGGAIETLHGQALFNSQEIPVWLRVGEHEGASYLDLGRDDWAAVKITSAGWSIVQDYPVRFRRPKGLRPLPLPERGGDLQALRMLVNVRDDRDWQLLVGFCLACLRPRGPYPVLIFSGESGAAKTTVSRILRLQLDPKKVPLTGPPKDARDVAVAAANSWVLGFDNLSAMPPWLSDCLCRIATGGGFSTRANYTDDEEALFDFERPVLLTSIEDVIERGDLLDRSLIVQLPKISKDRRRCKEDVERDAELARPGILGSLLDAAVEGLRNLPEVRLERLPRMADFAKWVTACEPALGWEPRSFLKAHQSNVGDANEIALQASPIAQPVRQFANDHKEWEGTATDLLEALKPLAGDKVNSKSWPKGGRALSGKLRRIAPNLDEVGVTVEMDLRDAENRRIIRLSLGRP